jgi:putative CocE/NonD family hydrolase
MSAYHDIVVDRDVDVPMGDGVTLVADVYRPGDEAPRPCLVQRVAYNKSHWVSLCAALDVLQAAAHGYAVVVQDCRGRFGSDGAFEPFVHEGADTNATVEWVACQPWSNGAVGLFGRSYSGMLQWLAAGDAHPAIGAMAPMLSGASLRRGWFAAQGVFETGFALLWCVGTLAADMLARTPEEGAPEDRQRLLGLMGRMDELLWNVDDPELSWLAERLPALAGLLERERHEETLVRYDALSTDPAQVAVPALIIAGWHDIFLENCLESHAALAPGRRGLVVGPWPHGGMNPGVYPERDFGVTASADAIGLTSIQLAWFDRWLGGGAPPPAVAEARTRLFAMGEDRWRTDADLDAERPTQTLFLAARGEGASLGLVAGEPAAARTSIAYDEDAPLPTVGGPTFLPGLAVAANAGPRDQGRVLSRVDVAVFEGDRLAEPLDLLGTVAIELEFEDVLPDMVVTVRLLDLGPDDAAMLVTEAAGRCTPLEGRARLRLRLGTTAYRFAAGHRVGVALAHASHPRFGRAVQAGHPAAGRCGASTLLTGVGSASRLELPLAR